MTVDRYLQFEAERALRDAVAEYGAIGGCAVVIGSVSGEILALASEPTFNPNLKYRRSVG